MFAFVAFTIVQENGGRSLSSDTLLFVPYLFFKILSYCCVLNSNTRLFHVLFKILCMYINHIHNIYFCSQWNISTIKYLQCTVTATAPCVPLPRELTGMQL